MHRREFLAASLAGATAIATGSQAGGATMAGAAAAAGEEKPARSRLTISCSSLPFAEMSWDAALEAMKELGFRRVELAMFEGWRHVFPSRLERPEEHGRKIREACARLDLEPVALHANFRPRAATGEFPGITTPDGRLRKGVLEDYERVLACVKAAGIPLLNVQPGKFVEGLPRERALENAIGTLKAMLASAKRAGVALSFENHTGSIAERPKETLVLLRGAPGVLVDLDLSHVVANSLSAEDVGPLLPFVGHVAIRNARPGDYDLPIDDAKLDFELGPYLDALRAAGVRSAFAIEYFESAKREYIAPLKRILEAHGLE